MGRSKPPSDFLALPTDGPKTVELDLWCDSPWLVHPLGCTCDDCSDFFVFGGPLTVPLPADSPDDFPFVDQDVLLTLGHDWASLSSSRTTCSPGGILARRFSLRSAPSANLYDDLWYSVRSFDRLWSHRAGRSGLPQVTPLSPVSPSVSPRPLVPKISPSASRRARARRARSVRPVVAGFVTKSSRRKLRSEAINSRLDQMVSEFFSQRHYTVDASALAARLRPLRSSQRASIAVSFARYELCRHRRSQKISRLMNVFHSTLLPFFECGVDDARFTPFWHLRATPGSHLSPYLSSGNQLMLDDALSSDFSLSSKRDIGATITASFFSDSPQRAAVLNGHLSDYFVGLKRARRTTPFAVPASLSGHLHEFGLEIPAPGSPSHPHPFNKSLELRKLNTAVSPFVSDSFGLICCKDNKLPEGISTDVQNPLVEAKDAFRFVSSSLETVDLSKHRSYVWHDVASVADPRLLAARLDASPATNLIVTGVNPPEVLDSAPSLYPWLYRLSYDGDAVIWVPEGHSGGAYTQSAAVTSAWWRTNVIPCANGDIGLHLVENEAGHCVWLLTKAKFQVQTSRSVPLGDYVRIPSSVVPFTPPSLRYVRLSLINSVVDFSRRTRDTSAINLAARVAQSAATLVDSADETEREMCRVVCSELLVESHGLLSGLRSFARFFKNLLAGRFVVSVPNVCRSLPNHLTIPCSGLGGFVRQSRAPLVDPLLTASPVSTGSTGLLTSIGNFIACYAIPKAVLTVGLISLFTHYKAVFGFVKTIVVAAHLTLPVISATVVSALLLSMASPSLFVFLRHTTHQAYAQLPGLTGLVRVPIRLIATVLGSAASYVPRRFLWGAQSLGVCIAGWALVLPGLSSLVHSVAYAGLHCYFLPYAAAGIPLIGLGLGVDLILSLLWWSRRYFNRHNLALMSSLACSYSSELAFGLVSLVHPPALVLCFAWKAFAALAKSFPDVVRHLITVFPAWLRAHSSAPPALILSLLRAVGLGVAFGLGLVESLMLDVDAIFDTIGPYATVISIAPAVTAEHVSSLLLDLVVSAVHRLRPSPRPFLSAMFDAWVFLISPFLLLFALLLASIYAWVSSLSTLDVSGCIERYSSSQASLFSSLLVPLPSPSRFRSEISAELDSFISLLSDVNANTFVPSFNFRDELTAAFAKHSPSVLSSGLASSDHVEPRTTVVVRERVIPDQSGPASVAALRIPPGEFMDCSTWASAVIAAYEKIDSGFSLPVQSSCFWQCVSKVVGVSPEGLFKFFGANRPHNMQPDPTGLVSELDISAFGALSGIGFQLARPGVGDNVASTRPGTNWRNIPSAALLLAPRPGWPTISLVVSTLSNGMRHVEPLWAPDRVFAPSALAEDFKHVSLEDRMRIIWLALHPYTGSSTATASTIVDNVRYQLQSLITASVVPAPPSSKRSVLDKFDFGTASAITSHVDDSVYGSPIRRSVKPLNRPEGVPDDVFSAIEDIYAEWSMKCYGVAPGANIGFVETVEKGLHFPKTVSRTIGSSPLDPKPNPADRAPGPYRGDPEIAKYKVAAPLISRLHHHVNTLFSKFDDLDGYQMPRHFLELETVSYAVDVHGAKALASDLKAHPSLLERDDQSSITKCIDAIMDTIDPSVPVSRDIDVLLGISGCGKTTKLREIISAMSPEDRSQCRIVSHNEFMRARLRRDFGDLLTRGFNYPTARALIAEPSTGCVIFDDGGKFWGGLMDLVILTNPLVTRIIVNGDPLQGREQIPLPMCQSKHLPSPVHSVSALASKYATISFRIPQVMADTLGVWTTSDRIGDIQLLTNPISGYPYITSSERYVSVLSQSGRTAFTFGTVQGLEFNEDVVMDITGLEQSISDSNCYVGLTRSKTGTKFMTNFLWQSPTNPMLPTGSDLLNAILLSCGLARSSEMVSGTRLPQLAFLSHLRGHLPRLFSDECSSWWASPNIGFSQAIADAIPMYLAAPVVHQLVSDGPEACPAAAAPVMTSVLPAVGLTEYHVKDPSTREVSTRLGPTAQFADDTRMTNPPFHSRYDRATEDISIAKRIRLASPSDNLRQYHAADIPDLKGMFDKVFPSCPQWSPDRHSMYAERVVDEYCSRRTESQVLAKIASQTVDQTACDIRLFLKQQVIKKLEKVDCDAVPGQLIHEFPLFTTLADSAFVLFLEEELLDRAPDNVVLLRRLTPSQLVEAYESKWHHGRGTSSNDYSAWDSGCDGNILALDVHIFKRLGFPQWYVDSYVHRKTHARSFVGSMRTMQNSGDRMTWPLNTLRNLVVTLLNLGYRSDFSYWFNGDDFICDGPTRPTGNLRTQLSFVGKPLSGPLGVFSGWLFGLSSLQVDAEAILYRCTIALSRNRLDEDYWRSVADQLSFLDPENRLYPEIANCFATAGQYHLLPPSALG